MKYILWFFLILNLLEVFNGLLTLEGVVEQIPFNQSNVSRRWDTCVYEEDDDVENAPWTVTLEIRTKKQGSIYFPAAILNSFTIITYGRGFVGGWNKFQILPPENYTVYIRQQQHENSNNNSNNSLGSLINISYVQPYHGLQRDIDPKLWMLTTNDFVLLYLNSSIKFSSNVRPICIPSAGDGSVIGSVQSLLDSSLEDSSVTNSGWFKAIDFQLITINLKLHKVDQCKNYWYNNSETKNYILKDKICGNGTAIGSTNNPDKRCINKESGVILISTETKKGYIIGFGNNYFSNMGVCDDKSIHYIIKMTSDVVKWVNFGLSCGPYNYTCFNGECISLHYVCDQHKHCLDGSDEDPKYCRGLNYCDSKTEVECGTYGDCIPNKRPNGEFVGKCDGIIDCPNGEDENLEECPIIKSEKNLLYFGLIGASIGCVCLLPLLIYLWRRKIRDRRLQKHEVKEFFEGYKEGGETNHTYNIAIEEGVGNDFSTNDLFDVKTLAYNQKFEYGLDKCTFIKDIAKGEFGLVRSAKLLTMYQSDLEKVQREEVEEEVEQLVAIKIPLIKSSQDIYKLKALLTELKFMQYIEQIGGHENIVKLIGAYTKEIGKCILNVAYEYCENGSILSYLRNDMNRVYFNNMFEDKFESGFSSGHHRYVKYVSCYIYFKFSTIHLIQWAIQIATGLEFLVSKKIVHGDLATRNTLLTANLTAKICDMGLSRQLYNYSIYTMKSEVPIPWPWMPIEVLETNTFNLKSDVWSYGVFLWELFSLGAEPWIGKKLCPEFVQELKSNKRLQIPEFGNEKIYNIMKQCWNCIPRERPNYLVMVQDFEIIKHLLNNE